MARALTAGELTSIRSDGQTSRLYLTIPQPATYPWWIGRVNGAPSSNDCVYELTFDAGHDEGAVAGMTLWVSGTGYGAYDKGMVRLREVPAGASGTLKIGETSEISWTDNDYLTVVEDFQIWPRHVYIDSNEDVFMDRDVDYSDQHENCDPIPVLGPDVVVWLDENSQAEISFDASDSWVPGSSISTYAWSATDGSWDDDTSATPTLTLDGPENVVRVSCTVTAANTASFTGHRYVYVCAEVDESDDWNVDELTQFTLDSCSGSWSSGGWSFRVTLYDETEVGLTSGPVHDRAKVILHARDWYGGTETSVGPVTDRENVIAVGWIDGESIDWNPEQGKVAFTVQGPQFWFEKIAGFPTGVEDYNGTPTDWTEFNNLTVDKGLWHFLHWRTTASLMMDWALTGDTRQVAQLEASVGSLWQQLVTMARGSILAIPCCDRYGRLFVEIDSNLLPVASRATIPTVHTIATQDWRESIEIDRNTTGQSSRIDLSGIYYQDASATAYFSLAPGHIFAQHGGSSEMRDHLALSSQNQSNTLAALVLAKLNNEYPSIRVPLASNHRMFDICPHQYGVIDITATDTEREIVESSLKIIPRLVSFSHDTRSGALLTDVEFEGYTTPGTSCNGDPPGTPPTYPTPPLPPIPIVPPVPAGGDAEAFCIGLSAGAWYTPDLTAWTDCSGGMGGQSWYDIKPSLTTRGQLRGSQIVWGIVAGNVVYSDSGAYSWGHRPLPITAQAWAVVPARLTAGTAYVLAANAANDQAWLCKTTNSGGSWSYLELVPAASTYGAAIDGHTNQIDINADDTYVYVMVSKAGAPTVVQVPADLSTQTEVYTSVFGGQLGGVRCDPSTAATVWIFGDFHASQIEKSTDSGASFADKSPAAANFVNVLMINESDTDDVVAYDSGTDDLHVTRNGGTSWTTDVDALPFTTYSGARGNSDASILLIGSDTASATHLQQSADTGATWAEASTGISPANAVITSITILWA